MPDKPSTIATAIGKDSHKDEATPQKPSPGPVNSPERVAGGEDPHAPASSPSLEEKVAKEAAKTEKPPAPDDEGNVTLPKGASVPPASNEPYNPGAKAWEPPLSDPPA